MFFAAGRLDSRPVEEAKKLALHWVVSFDYTFSWECRKVDSREENEAHYQPPCEHSSAADQDFWEVETFIVENSKTLSLAFQSLVEELCLNIQSWVQYLRMIMSILSHRVTPNSYIFFSSCSCTGTSCKFLTFHWFRHFRTFSTWKLFFSFLFLLCFTSRMPLCSTKSTTLIKKELHRQQAEIFSLHIINFFSDSRLHLTLDLF